MMWWIFPGPRRRWLWRQRMMRRRWGCCGPVLFLFALVPLLAILGLVVARHLV